MLNVSDLQYTPNRLRAYMHIEQPMETAHTGPFTIRIPELLNKHPHV